MYAFWFGLVLYSLIWSKFKWSKSDTFPDEMSLWNGKSQIFFSIEIFLLFSKMASVFQLNLSLQILLCGPRIIYHRMAQFWQKKIVHLH